MRLQFALAMAVVLCLPLSLGAQSRRADDLGVGKLLVAPRDCPDPTFANAVILLVNFDPDGAVGIIINHRTKVPISRALEQLKAANHRSDPMYMGGPVDLSAILALLRSSTKPDDARRVLGDVYLVSTQPLLEKTLAGSAGPDQFHAYAGYCGWAAGQLQSEMAKGVWYIFNGAANWVFDSDPASVWSRLIARTEENIVLRRPADRIGFAATGMAYAGLR